MRRGGGWGPKSYAQVADQGGGGGRGRAGGGAGRGGQGSRNGPGHGAVRQESNDVQEMMNGVQAGRQAQVAEREARDLKNQALRKKAYLQLKWDLDSNRIYIFIHSYEK